MAINNNNKPPKGLDMPIINGTAYWAKLERPAQKYNTTSPTETEYVIDLAIDKKGKELITSLNPSSSIKNKEDDRGDFFTFKKNAFNRKGDPLPKPRLVDAKENSIAGTLIGNGSKVRVAFRVQEIENEKSAYNGKNKFYLDGVQVVDLIPYESSESFGEVDGYVAESTGNSGVSSEEKAPF